MRAKHGIWCCRALHQWKVFLTSQGRTLAYASIFVDITLIDPIWQAKLWNLRDSWKYNYNTFLVHEAIHLVRSMVTYLPTMGRDTLHFQVYSLLSFVPF